MIYRLILTLCACCELLNFQVAHATSSEIVDAVHKTASKISTEHIPQSDTVIHFTLHKGALKQNLQRLLDEHSEQHIFWEVSEHHKIAIDVEVTAFNIYQLVNEIISPYKQPSQIKAKFYGNKIVRFYYDDSDSLMKLTR